MKHTLVFFLAASVVMSSCHKWVDPNHGAMPTCGFPLLHGNLRFGTSSVNGPELSTRYYIVDSYAVYVDTVHPASNPDSTNYTKAALPKSDFPAAYQLLLGFPLYMDTATGTHSYFGGIGAPMLHLAHQINGHTATWDVTQDTALLPLPIRAYVQEVNDALKQL